MSDPVQDFDYYADVRCPDERRRTEEILVASTPLNAFERYVYRITWAIAYEHVKFSNDLTGEIGRHFISKVVMDCRALIGAMRCSSFTGVYHQLRSLMEITAQAYYLFAKPKEVSHRVQKWKEYPALLRYSHRRALELALEQGEISQSMFDERAATGSPDATSVGDEQIRLWKKLWKIDEDALLVKPPPSWMHKATYSGLLEEMHNGDFKEIVDPRQYAICCHGTHLSPSSMFLHAGLEQFQIQDHSTVLFHSWQLVEATTALLPSPGENLLSVVEPEKQALLTRYAACILGENRVDAH